MKILYLCPDLGIPVLGRKGAAVHVRELIGAFSRAGHDVVLAAQMLNKSPWEKPAEVAANVLQVRPSPAAGASVQAFKEFNETLGVENSLSGELRRILYNTEMAAELKRRFENDPPAFIYERASIYATGGATLAKQFGVPHVLELNAPLAVEQAAYRATGFGELAAQAERWTLTRSDAVCVVSNELRKHAVSLGVNAAKIHVLPNGVNTELFKPGRADAALRRKLKLGNGPVVGFVGGLRPWHGVEVLPELLARLAKVYPKVRLVIAGDGPMRRDLERDFKKRGLENNVVITGLVPHEEVPALIRLFDVALAPYPKPDHAFYFSPLKLFEYMGCGVPVVAADIGQISEIVRDGKTGVLCAPGSIGSLADGCVRLLKSAKLRASIGKAAAKIIHADYTWDKNAARVIGLARALVAAKKK